MTSARRAAIALAVVCLGLAAAGGAAEAKSKKHQHHHHHHRKHTGGGSASEGRDHLKRANALAGEGDCEAAIEEYTKAYELLDDPVVLFNRAECYRRTGNGESAADDYRAFLDKVPNAPNRADIEAKIVALEAPEPAARETPKTTTPAPPVTPKVVEERLPPTPPPPPAPRPETKAEPAVTVTAVHREDPGSTGGSRPWVWVALSVLAVGAAVGGYFLLRPREEPPPQTALGNYRF